MSAFQKSFKSPVPLGADVAVGVSGKSTLVGIALSGGKAWSFEHALDSRPAVAGKVVVGLGAGELFALDSRTGKLLWKRNAGGRLRGAGDDGATTVISILPTTGLGSVVLAVNHEGHVVRQIEDAATIGVPAVVDGYAFLPWQGQYVTIYDLHAGEEKARALFRSATSRAFAAGGALFFGENGVTRFDDAIGLASRSQGASVKLPDRELPGAPRWMRPGSEATPLATAAFDQVRLYARPTASGAPGVSGGRYAATYFRVAVGLDAASGALAWAHAHDAEILGGAAYEGGFALCDGKGAVTFLDARSGSATGHVELGRPLTSCVVQADAFTQPASSKSPSLTEQIADVARLPDADLVPMQQVLLQELTRIDSPLATRTLIDLAASERTAPALIEAARAALSARRTGADEMLAALDRRYDHLAGVLLAAARRAARRRARGHEREARSAAARGPPRRSGHAPGRRAPRLGRADRARRQARDRADSPLLRAVPRPRRAGDRQRDPGGRGLRGGGLDRDSARARWSPARPPTPSPTWPCARGSRPSSRASPTPRPGRRATATRPLPPRADSNPAFGASTTLRL